jgi:zinc protease
MISRKNMQAFLVTAALLCATAFAGAQQAASSAPQTAPLAQAIPIDPQIKTGTLSNGLRYYVKKNKKPENRAELRLAVNAGSLLEADDQQGLAHFVEHMAFNGTSHFPKNEMVQFLESIGMRFGADVNAYTSFDETVYQLQVPTDKPEVLTKSFLILRDWAHEVTFDPTEIDKERGVIMEEWRFRRGAGARLQEKQFPILLKGSRYAERIPIGKTDIIQNGKHDRLKQFYTDWYRPDLMAVVAVGDFDAAAIETIIKDQFGSIPRSTAPKARTVYPVPETPGTLYAIATDREMTQTSVSVYSKMPLRDQSTIAAYRQQIVERLFSSMLSTRYSELAQKPDPPFLGAGANRGIFVRSAEASTLSAGVKEDGVERGLEALFTEAERVARSGFTSTELDRVKRNVLRGLERAVAEKDNQPSGSLADEYTRQFTDREPIPGIEYEYALYQRFLPEITITEVNALAKDWVPDRNRVVLVSGPDKAGLTMPDEKKLAAVMASVSSKKLDAYVDTATSTTLLDSAPSPGTVAKTTTKDAFGITEWELSNGVKVVLKPTTFKEDEILFRAFSPGGTSLASNADYIPAMTSSQVVSSGGVGKFSRIELPKILSGKVASAQPFIGELTEGLSGSASRKDLETMFQLIYLRFTQPRADEGLFQVMKDSTKSQLANQKASPEFVFGETLQTTLNQNHPRRRPMTVEMVDQMDLQKSMSFYKDRFADASDFTFVFVGSFDPPTLKPLVERYLGALPSTRRKETWKDVEVETVKGVVVKKVEKGIEPKSRATIVYSGPFQYTQDQRIAINAMGDVLENRLREKLREDLGGTYSVSVGPSYSKLPRSEYSLSIAFGSNPDRTEELVKTVYSEIELLKSAGPTDKQVADVKETLLREYESNQKQNGYLLGQIANRYELSEDLTSLFALQDYYNKLTPAIVQEAATKYLDSKNRVEVTLFPEKK